MADESSHTPMEIDSLKENNRSSQLSATSDTNYMHTEALTATTLQPSDTDCCNLTERFTMLGKPSGAMLLEAIKKTLEPGDNPYPDLQNYINIYKRMYDWANNSLDNYKEELLTVCFAVFIEMYARLLLHNPDVAANFIETYAPLHESQYQHIVQTLKVFRHPMQLQECPYLRFSQPNKRNNIYLSKKGLKALQAWLVDCNSVVLLNIIQESCELHSFDVLKEDTRADRLSNSLGYPDTFINRQPVHWGLPRVLYQAEATVDKGSTKVSSAMHSEPTVMVDSQHLLPLPEAGTPIYAYYRNELKTQTARRHLLSAQSLPNSLCYTLHNSFGLSTVCVSAYNGAFVAAGFDDSIVRIWNIKNYTKSAESVVNEESGSSLLEWHGCASLVGHDGPVYALVFGEHNRVLLSGGCDSTILLWSVDSRAKYMSYCGGATTVWSLDFAPFGYYFASGESDTQARLWVTERSKPLRILSGHAADVDIVRFHPNSGYLFTASSDATIRMWDLRTEKCVRLFYPEHRNVPITALAVSHNGRLLASADVKNISLWDIPMGMRLFSYPTASRIRSLAFCYGSTLLASGSVDGKVSLFDISSAACEPANADSETNVPLNEINSSLATSTPLLGKRETHNNVYHENSIVKQYALRDAQVHFVSFTPENVLLVGAASVQYRA